jgi:hypothetical protein
MFVFLWNYLPLDVWRLSRVGKPLRRLLIYMWGEVMVVIDCMEVGLQARIWASLAIF